MKDFYCPFQRGTSFVNHLCFFVSCVSHAFASVLAALWSPAWKGLTSWPFGDVYCIFVTPGSGVVLNCIVS